MGGSQGIESMSAWLFAHWYVLAGALLVGLSIVYFLYATVNPSKNGAWSALAYILFWPLILDGKRKGQKSSTRFVVIGLLIMVLLVVGSILWHPNVR